MNCRYFGELEIVHQCPASLLGQSTQDKLKHEVALLQVFGLLPLFRFSTSMESGVMKVQLDAVRQPIAVSDISIYICLIDIRDGSSKPVYGGVHHLQALSSAKTGRRSCFFMN